MTMTTTPTGAKLREEDLAVGRRWVHPESRLEWEDFHAFLAGKDPVPHWRNARIKELHAQADGWRRECAKDPEREPWETYRDRRIAYFFHCAPGGDDEQPRGFGTRFMFATAFDLRKQSEHAVILTNAV